MDHKVAGYTSVLEDIRIMSTAGGKNVYSSKVLLSQFIVLPPYQGLGLGSTLLRAVYDYYLNQKQCIEFSVEEPSDEFQSLMDLIEIKLIWQAGFFQTIKENFRNKRKSLCLVNKENFD